MSSNYPYQPDLVPHPGDTLQETLETVGMSQAELAERTDLSPKTISEIVNGKSSLTPENAIKFERIFGISASFWNNLEKNHQEWLARTNAEKKLDVEAELAKKFVCYNELVKWGVLAKTKTMKDKARNLLNFFGVDSLSLIPKIEGIAYRKSDKYEISHECLAAWLRWGELEAQDLQTQEFDKEKLLKNIQEFRKLIKEDPGVTEKRLRELGADCGVAIIFKPYLKNTYVNGATRWINNKALIQLSLRNSYTDIFWFTFFHEIGHILKHGKKDRCIELEKDDQKDSKEKEADKYASEILIPTKDYTEFVDRGDFSVLSIKAFSDQLDITPGIVAGRLAYEEKVSWKQVWSLRQRLKFVEPTISK